MAKLPGSYETELEDDDFDVVPAGWKPMEMIKNEWKDVKDNPDHKYLECTFKILGEESNGRLIWLRLNLINSGAKAVNIARKDLSRISKACGFSEEPEDADELMNIPIEGKVTIKPETAQWPAGNELKGFRAYEDSASPSASKSESAPAKKSKPWEKK